MNITFYKTGDERNRVDKTLTNALSLNGNLREEVSILSPTIRIFQPNANIVGYNYCYIPDFNRYYFITDIKTIRTGIWDVSLSVDVLMSFKNEIKQLNCIVSRQEHLFNLLLNDTSFVVQSNPSVNTIAPNSEFEYGPTVRYILTVAGKGN